MPHKKCLTCMNEITERFIDLSTTDKELRKTLLDEITRYTEEHFDEIKLPDYTTIVLRQIAERTGVDDPFLEIKKESNFHFIKIIDQLRGSIENLDHYEALKKLVLFSIAANMVDFSTGGHDVDIAAIAGDIVNFPKEGLAIDDFDLLFDIINNSQTILLLSDNCGETVVDNLIVEYLVNSMKKKVYFGLKGAPVANDCSVTDFERDKLEYFATETFAASSGFGWNLDESSNRFLGLLQIADVLIVKGQSNYETTLNNLVRYPERAFPPIFNILRTKCDIITKHLGVPFGSNVVKQMYPVIDQKKITEITDCE